VRFLAHYKQNLALKLIPEFSAEFEKAFGRETGGLLRTYRADDADMLVVAMGSVCGTIKDTIDEMREEDIRIGLVTIVSFRPFPIDALRNALAGATDVVVVEKSIAVGMGGQLANNVDVALRNLPHAPHLHSAVAGLGGRAITRASLHRLFRQAAVQPWEGVHFLDLNERVVGREIHRTRKNRRSGPTAENILRQLAEADRPAAE
jgi:pyruvate ferredoxin oxidoreductase alpha subunit